jgi:hypothetical protein
MTLTQKNMCCFQLTNKKPGHTIHNSSQALKGVSYGLSACGVILAKCLR